MQVKVEDQADDGGADADARGLRESALDPLPVSVHASLKEEVMCPSTASSCRMWFLLQMQKLIETCS
jgi:hypothetical protein